MATEEQVVPLKEGIYDNPDELVKSLSILDNKVFEDGGFIVEKKGKYQFVYVPNMHMNTLIGGSLYEADKQEFATRLSPLFSDGWLLYGSVHTHPTFTSKPSTIDYNKLFQTFKVNYIKSIKYNTISKYTWIDDIHLEIETIL